MHPVGAVCRGAKFVVRIKRRTTMNKEGCQESVKENRYYHNDKIPWE